MLTQIKNINYLEHGRMAVQVLLKVVSLFSPLILIPIVLDLTSADIYGRYFAILSLFYFIIALDLGIANIANGNFAQLHANSERSRLLYINQSRKALNRTFIFLIIPSMLLCYFLTNHISGFDWKTFEVTSFKISAMFTFAVYLALIGNLGVKLEVAQLKTVKIAFIMTAQILVSFILLISGIDDVNLLHLVFFFILLPQVPIALNFIYTWRIFVTRDSSESAPFKSYRLTELVRQGSLFMFLQIATVISTQIDSLVVGIVLGGVAASEIAITWRYYAVPLQFLTLFAMPLWGLAAVSKVDGNSILVWHKLKRLIMQSVAFAMVFSIASFFVAKLIIETWTAGVISPSRYLIFCCSIWLVLSSIIIHVASVLNGWGERRILFRVYLASSLVNLLLSFFLTSVLDSNIGVLLGSILAQSLFFLLPSLLYLRREMSIERQD
jgi:O-antigen/teichoic acid export membrane protein